MLRKLTITLLAVALSGIGIAAVVSGAGASADNQTSSVLYSSLVSPYSATNSPNDSYSATNLPNEWWSFSFGGNNATQFGDKINLASQSSLGSATVILDSQACQTGSGTSCVTTDPRATFPVSITFTIYEPGASSGTVGAVLASETQTFNVPYRPSANSIACPAGTPSIFPGPPPLDGGEWFNPATGTCYYGKTYAATFKHFTSHSHGLPTTVVYGVSYSASSSLAASSLNVLLSTESASGAVTVGSDTDPGNLFLADTAAGTTSPEITCTTPVGTSFAEYNTAVGAGGCGTDTQQGPGAPYEPIAFVPAVELDSSN